ncbi:MAG: MaoC/PaaZ C-terminal domain-containing protein [Burkholderiaceae bacterium]|nr:MaoC/PaaZ C-terminal domain-containing protein [Burkholderiaceae bacterium]
MKSISQAIAPISLEQMIRFAGAVQDFNPIHYDDRFARNAGLPGVIAQGPLTFLAALDALFALGEGAPISGLRVRLKAPVTPDAPLSITCDENGRVSLTAGGVEVLAGEVLGAAGVKS